MMIRNDLCHVRRVDFFSTSREKRSVTNVNNLVRTGYSFTLALKYYDVNCSFFSVFFFFNTEYGRNSLKISRFVQKNGPI